jgi:hypothetical protein
MMDDERQETYERLIGGLLALPGFLSPSGSWVKLQDVIGLLAEEFLTERRGSQSENSTRAETKQG